MFALSRRLWPLPVACSSFFLSLGLVLPAPVAAPPVQAAQPHPHTVSRPLRLGVLTLEAALERALLDDPWLQGSQYTERALMDEATAAAALPDPSVSLRAGNFPVDTLDINQEGMTQTSVGISQRFPRGQSRVLAQQQKQQLAAQQPLLRLDRRARVRADVTQLWLEVFVAQQSLRLIEADRTLFEQLADATDARYAAGMAKSSQQDAISARLELLRLDDRISVLAQRRDRARQRLGEWLGQGMPLPVAEELPDLQLLRPLPSPAGGARQQEGALGAYHACIAQHPSVRALAQRTEVAKTEVELARQHYKPEWGLSAQYGYRAEDLAGRERADLFSVGLTFDLPLFTAKRQDKNVSAALSRYEAMRTEQLLLSRQLVAQLRSGRAELARLDQRALLYGEQLLPQLAEQSAAALSAYQSDDGELSALLRARMAELDARIEALDIAVQRLQRIARINYLLSEAPTDEAGLLGCFLQHAPNIPPNAPPNMSLSRRPRSPAEDAQHEQHR
jgi:outer membrane protein TolC